MPLPFLAHNTARGEFIIINELNKQIKANPGFEKGWDGTALLAEKPDNWQHAENEERLSKEKRIKQTSLVTILFVVSLASLCLINNFSWQLTGLLIITLAGFAIAVLIVQHELGISNELTEQLCSTGKNTDCDAVMHSKGSRIGKWMNWSDAGIIYFASYSLLLVILVYTESPGNISNLAILSVAAVPITLFSLYYQWRVVKKWCTLCLLTIGVLWVQSALLAPVTVNLTKNEWGYFIFNLLALTTLIFSLVAAGWLLLLKPALRRNTELTDKNFSLLRFKNNPAVFAALLQEQRKVDITPFENDLQLGNPYAPVQIVVACNPYCGPCAKAHEVLHDIVSNNDDVGLTVRFTVNANNKDDKRTQAVEYISQLLSNTETAYKKEALHSWYAEMNLEKFREKYPLYNKVNADLQLKENEWWGKETGIAFTPTIFINGYELPKQYNVADLKQFLRNRDAEEIFNEVNYAFA